MLSNPYYYIGPNPTVDLAVINPLNQILLIKRSEQSAACPGLLALPGGFIDSTAPNGSLWVDGDTESPIEAAIRELAEETNLILPFDTDIQVLGIYQGNKRDPRDNNISWSKSYAFMYQITQEIYDSQKDSIKGMDDATDASWHNLDDIDNLQLAFDHNIIINDMKKKLFPKTTQTPKI